MVPRISCTKRLGKRIDLIESQFQTVKVNLDRQAQESKTAIESKVAAAKTNLDTKKQEADALKGQVEQWVEAKKGEAQATLNEWVAQKQQDKLLARAKFTEEYAVAAIKLAAIAISEAELATLEAIDARMMVDEAISK